MTQSITSDVFEFIDDLAVQIREGKLQPWEDVERDSTVVIFCESLFDQFFSSIEAPITGFGRRAKRKASEVVENLRASDSAATATTRRVIAIYESVCDAYDDLVGSYGSDSIDHLTFYQDYLEDLLDAVRSWSESRAYSILARVVSESNERLRDAIEETAWLTRKKPTKKESGLSRATFRRRTTS